MTHRHSLKLRNFQISRSSWERWRLLQAVFLQKIRTLLRLLDGLGISNRYRDQLEIEKQYHFQTQNWHLFSFSSILTFLFLDLPIVNRTEALDQGFLLVWLFLIFAKNSQVEDWYLRACKEFSNQPMHIQASHWIHLKKFSTALDYIFFYLNLKTKYIHHKIHKFCWYWSIHDFLSAKRNSLDVLFCKPREGKCTQ